MNRVLLISFCFIVFFSCNDAVKISNDFSVPEDVVLGNKALFNENYPKAKEYYLKAIKEYPDCAIAYNNLAELYEIQELYDSSLFYFNLSLSIDSLNPYTFNNRGELFEVMGEYELSMQDFNRAIGIDSTFSIAYLNRGELYLETNSLHLSMKDYNKAIQINPNK